MSEATGGPLHHQLIVQKPGESPPILKVDEKPEKSLPTGIAKVDGKYVPWVTFLRRKYRFGHFETPDEAVLAYNTMTSQARSLLSGTEPRKHGEPANGNYFDSVESRIQVLEEDLVRLRQSEVSNATRVSLVDVRLRAANEKHQAGLAQVHDQLRAVQEERDQARTELAQARTELNTTRVELRSPKSQKHVELMEVQPQLLDQGAVLTQVKKQLCATETERDQARTELLWMERDLDQERAELTQANGQRYVMETERDQARTELTQVKKQLCAMETERDQARTELTQVKKQLCAMETERDQARAKLRFFTIKLSHVEERLRSVETERDQARRCLEESVKVPSKRTHGDMLAGLETVDIEAELEAVREKNATLQLALDIKTSELQKEIKRRRQCQCPREVVEILD